MSHIPGFKLIKNKKGKITHVRLNMKHHKKIIEDIFFDTLIEKAQKGKFIKWETAKKIINKKFSV